MNIPLRLKYCSAVAIMGVLLAGGTVRAQQAWVGLFRDPTAADCHLDTSDSGTRLAYLVVTKTFDFHLISLKATVPPGVTWVADFLPSSMMIGSGFNSQSGMWLVPSGSYCIGGPNLLVLTIAYSAPTALPPTSWDVVGAFTPNVAFLDCGSGAFTGLSTTAWLSNPGANCSHFQHLAPYFPYPPDDGVNMPTNLSLGFKGDANHIWLSTEPFDTPRDEDIVCATAGGASCPNPFDPGALAPHTTYYWMAGNVCDPPSEDCANALSDVWSFTTGEGPLAVQSSTWGKIKALYR